MSVEELLLVTSAAAVIAVGSSLRAEAQPPSTLPSQCDLYARQYAAATTRLEPSIFRCAYNYAHSRCVAGGPSYPSSADAVPRCVHERCEPVYTICVCGGKPPTWKRYVGLGC